MPAWSKDKGFADITCKVENPEMIEAKRVATKTGGKGLTGDRGGRLAMRNKPFPCMGVQVGRTDDVHWQAYGSGEELSYVRIGHNTPGARGLDFP